MMFTRSLVLLSVVALFFAGCKGKHESGTAAADQSGTPRKVLQFGNGAEPQFIDPQLETGVPEHTITRAIFEGLVSEGPNETDIMPGVAEKWEVSADGLTYTFHLRADAKWSDGTSVTANDFLRSYQRMLTPAVAADYVYMLFVVRGAEDYYAGRIKNFEDTGFKSSDPRTLQLILSKPAPFLLNALKHPAWYPIPVAVVEKFNDMTRRDVTWTRLENIVGNGPFRLTQWLQNQKIVAERSPTYWDRANVKLDEIVFHAVEQSDTEERMFRTGQLDITNDVPVTKLAVYRRDFPKALRVDPLSATYFYRLNTARKPLDDVRVRRALSLSIDRESIIKNVLLGGQQPAYSYVPPNTAGYVPQYKLHSDIAEAKKLLAEAGFPDGKGFPHLQLSYNTFEVHRAIAEAIQEMWRRNLGIEISLSNEEWKVFLSDQKSLNFDIQRAGWVADYQDPHVFLDTWKTGTGNNFTNWGSSTYDQLLESALDSKTTEARYAVYQKMEKILLDEMPIIPIYFYTHSRLVGPRVTVYKLTLLDAFPWKDVDVTPSP